jgi:hypothetical protein
MPMTEYHFASTWRLQVEFTTGLPYRLGFDIQVRHLQPPTTLEAVATGELEASDAGR